MVRFGAERRTDGRTDGRGLPRGAELMELSSVGRGVGAQRPAQPRPLPPSPTETAEHAAGLLQPGELRKTPKLCTLPSVLEKNSFLSVPCQKNVTP